MFDINAHHARRGAPYRSPARSPRSPGVRDCEARPRTARARSCGSPPTTGAEGVALAPRRGAGRILERHRRPRVLRDELVGADAAAREWLWHRMWELDRTEELPLYILGLVDTALWDLAGRVGGPAGLAAPRRLPAVDPGLRVDRDVRDARGISRCRSRSASTRLPGDQTARLGRCPRRRRLCLARARARRPRRRAHVRRLGRLRPRRRHLPRPRARRRRLPLVRGADPRVQRDRVQVAEPSACACRCASRRPRTACT